MIDYTPEELTGQNLYTLCHGEDAAKLRKSHLDCKLTREGISMQTLCLTFPLSLYIPPYLP